MSVEASLADAGVECPVLDLYGAGLAGAAGELWARRRNGPATPLPLERWLGPLTDADSDVLDRARAPVLDIGCGPGRHVLALARRGVMALGIDVSEIAVAHVRRRGAVAIEASVFERVPGAGRWGSALLLDGNIGIGGCPRRLLRRIGALVEPGGTVLVELEAPGAATTSEELRLEHGERVSGWFPWATVGVDAMEEIAHDAGFAVEARWERSGRWFACLCAR